MNALFRSWFYLKPVFFWLIRAQVKSWNKDPIFWLMIYVPIGIVLVLSLFPSLAEVVLTPAHAAEQAPAMPDIKNYDSAAMRQKNASRMDAAEQAARSGKMPSIPNIRTPMHGADIDQIANQYKQKALTQNGEELLIFVSLSMPQDALIKLARQARVIHAVLVMRGVDGGLQKGNWSRAMNALKPLTDTGASIVIHPDYFKQYKVASVPTFVLTSSNPTETCDNATACTQRLQASGDVSLDYVLERWADGKGVLAGLAKAKLTQLEQPAK
ncbi:MAG: type-F conjugative transfer system pilin assembly protein TrbC [Methylophilaceae bacterium]|nr:type-F conjugative transfer system pilin assembly protein TrbC [Methylophilaceae bacterium]